MPIWKLSKKHLKFFQKEEFTSYLPFSISYLSSLLFFAGSGTIIQVLRIRLRKTGFIRILRSIQFNCRKRRESFYNSRVTESPPPPPILVAPASGLPILCTILAEITNRSWRRAFSEAQDH